MDRQEKYKDIERVQRGYKISFYIAIVTSIVVFIFLYLVKLGVITVETY